MSFHDIFKKGLIRLTCLTREVVIVYVVLMGYYLVTWEELVPNLTFADCGEIFADCGQNLCRPIPIRSY